MLNPTMLISTSEFVQVDTEAIAKQAGMSSPMRILGSMTQQQCSLTRLMLSCLQSRFIMVSAKSIHVLFSACHRSSGIATFMCHALEGVLAWSCQGFGIARSPPVLWMALCFRYDEGKSDCRAHTRLWLNSHLMCTRGPLSTCACFGVCMVSVCFGITSPNLKLLQKLAVRIRGTLGDKDPLNKVRVKRGKSRVKKGPL